MKIYDCSAIVSSKHFQREIVISKDYRANSKENALKGFTEYLESNKEINSFKNIIIN
jgi:hypothetical protein